MTRTRLTLDEFKQALANDWRAVYAAFGEDYWTRPTKVVQVDLFCEWRVRDGNRWFVEVPFDTDEEMAQIKIVLDESVNALTQAVLEHFAKINPKSFAEAMEAVGDVSDDLQDDC